mgnify:CR=1 FL=1
MLLAVDNLPCELPKDASTFFSRQLKPFIAGLLKANYHSTLEDCGLPPEIRFIGPVQEKLAYEGIGNMLTFDNDR